MPGYFFAAAALVAFVAFLTHSIVGGKYAVRPLFAASDITPASRWLNYLCWHMATVLLIVMATTLACVATNQISRDAAIPIAIMAFSTSVLSVAITLQAGIHPLRFPASYLLGLVGVLTSLGYFSSKPKHCAASRCRKCVGQKRLRPKHLGLLHLQSRGKPG